MGLISIVKGAMQRMFKKEVKETFDVADLTSSSMASAVDMWLKIYQGSANWIDDEENIKTIKFAKSICSETARLSTLDVAVNFDGTRADYFDAWYNKSVASKLRTWVEYGCAVGTVILKPNGDGIDLVMPNNFQITAVDSNGNIRGIVFQDSYIDTSAMKKTFYTKLEYHRLDENEYVVTNKTYKSGSVTDIGKPCDILDTKWRGLQEEVTIKKADGESLDSMLFGVFRCPSSNDIEINSPMGLAIFSDAIEELKDLDVAYSRNAEEIFNSARIELLDQRLVQMPSTRDAQGNVIRHKQKLPKHIINVNSDSAEEFYQEINPNLNTQTRIEGINNLLSFIGYKCGYSNGYFVLDQKTGMVTATQVEADDRRTIQLIKDVRESIEKCLNDLIYAQSVFADLYSLAPSGDYEAHYDFMDITYNVEEDRLRHWNYVQQGKYPLWRYYMKFEGMSEEEAKEVVAETETVERGLFDE